MHRRCVRPDYRRTEAPHDCFENRKHYSGTRPRVYPRKSPDENVTPPVDAAKWLRRALMSIRKIKGRKIRRVHRRLDCQPSRGTRIRSDRSCFVKRGSELPCSSARGRRCRVPQLILCEFPADGGVARNCYFCSDPAMLGDIEASGVSRWHRLS